MSKSFQVSLLGSMPRERDILKANRDLKKGRMSEEDYSKLIEAKTKEVIDLQEEYGVDIITSGELARDNYVSFIADFIQGVEMMSMSDMLDYIEDKKAYEAMLSILDVPATTIKNAICVGRIKREKSMCADELKMMHQYSDSEKKVTLPGPYLIARSMWLKGLSDQYYVSKEELGQDVIKILLEEVEDLQEMGVDIIQFDEPVLTEVVFSPENTRTFMCASLSEKKDPAEELAFAEDLLKGVFDHIDRSQTKLGLHVCRGNWSKDEEILLSGPYTPLLDLFDAVKADIYYLEYSTDRAGDIESLFEGTSIFDEAILGLGVMNPRSDETESKERIIAQVEEVLNYLPAERIHLNPDCGFATFAQKPVNEYGHIREKLKVLNEVSHELRERYE